MRTILEHQAQAREGSLVEDLTLASLAEYGWSAPDIGVTRSELVSLASRVIKSAEKADRDLPVSPESQYIQEVIDRAYKTKSATGPQQFVAFSFERNCLEQAILVLCQIDPKERAEAFQRDMTIMVGPEYAVYGILFGAIPTAKPHSGINFQTRLRCNDVNQLQEATASFVSALNPTERRSFVRRFSSRGASVGTSGPRETPFVSEVKRLEIRSVANEKLFTGDVVPITGRLSLLRQAAATQSAGVLFLLSLLLIAGSAVLFGWFPDEGWWMWSEQTMGRLATAAFGALLIDTAIDYTALRKTLKAGIGPVTHGAVIKWTRPNLAR